MGGKSKSFVLLPPDCISAIEILLAARDSCGVPTSNKYLFACPNTDTPRNGAMDMAQLVKECPRLDNADRLTSAKLRKYIATTSQVKELYKI